MSRPGALRVPGPSRFSGLHPRAPNWFWLGLRALLTAGALVAACLAAIDGYGQVDRARPADVIVILGAQVHPGGRPGPSLVRRTRHAVSLYTRGLAAHVICSGGQGDFLPSEAEAACALAQSMGVPAGALLREDQSHSTEENARYTAALMRARGWTTAIVVSDGFHLYRANLLFRRAGVQSYTSPAQVTTGPMPWLERRTRELRELAALAWYWAKTLLGLPISNVNIALGPDGGGQSRP